MAGRTISHYEILETLGEGGMGVVSLARDTRLGRQVAIKLLRADTGCEPDQKMRFLQEARTASSLNHPNIVTIYDIETVDGVDLIAMEFVPGKTIERKALGRKLPLAEVLSYATQIAGALEAAHRAGIVHRDIKPSNIMVTDAGVVKVLDFGLAKIRREGPERSASSTASSPHTVSGTLIGTLAYMSPEQASAQTVDERSDLFSLGVLLYELLTGKHPFPGRSNAEILSGILRDTPAPVRSVVPETPAELSRLVDRCLRKDPNRRIQSAADLRVSLLDIADDLGGGSSVEPASPTAPAARRSPRTRWIAAFAAVVMAAIGLAWWSYLTPPKNRSTVLTRLTSDPGLTSFPAISPDGSLVAYASDRAGQLDIYIQQVAGGPPIRLTQHPTDDYEPSFSPDGSLVAFRSERDGGGIYVVPALGGRERLIATEGRSPSFSPDGTRIAYAVGSAGVGATFAVGASRVYVIPVAGGDAVRLAPGFPVAHHPQWTPDGENVIFLGNKVLGPPTYDLWLVPPSGGEPRETGVFRAVRDRGMTMGAHPFAVAGNAILLSVGVGDSVNLWRVPVRPLDCTPAGQPEQLTFGTGRELEPSVSRDGKLVFSSGQQNSDVWELPLDADKGIPTGPLRQLTREAGDDYYPSISDDGTRIAFVSKRTGNDDVWLFDTATGRGSALLVTPAREMYPKLSADGSVVAFGAIDRNRRHVYYMPSTGGVATKLCDDCGLLRDISADGTRLLLQMGPPPHIGLLDVATRVVTPLIRHESQPVYAPKFSPDNRSVAFQAVTSASARRIYITRMDTPDQWIPVTDGKTMDRNPFWSPDGNLLYYLSERDGFGCIWAQKLDARTRRAVGDPFAVVHFHEAMRSPMNLDGTGPVSPSIAKDRLVLSMGENRANVWMSRL